MQRRLRLHTVKIILIFLMQNPLERKNLSLKAELPGPGGDLAVSLMASKQQNRQKKE